MFVISVWSELVIRMHATQSYSPNAADQRLATIREPRRLILSRVRCIGLFAAALLRKQ
jgi:hypothetical protein